MTEPGPHGEPWGVNDLDEGELSEGRRAWSHIVACVNAMHAAGIRNPEGLVEFIAAAEVVLENWSEWDDEPEPEISKAAKARNRSIRAYGKLKSALAALRRERLGKGEGDARAE